MSAEKTFSIRPGLLMLLASFVLCSAPATGAEATREEVLAAMKKAATFMSEDVSVQGGYVWFVSADLTQRWGELRARPSQIWLQGGTERVGQLMLDAYQATFDDFYLDVARKAADAIVFGQTREGGWHYFIDFDPAGVPQWYREQASRFRYGMEEYRFFYGNATFDDRVTADAGRFLLRYYGLTHEAAYRDPVLKSLEFMLESQYPNGAWPQRYPLRDDYAHDGFPDYTSFFTLNDGATQANIEFLLDGYTTLGDPRYFEAAERAVDALIEMQGPDGQAAWAEQYGSDMRPIAARTHEPPGYVVRESQQVLSLLSRFYLMTGDPRYLAPIPPCLDWFDRINRESANQHYPRPRYWEPGSNRPVYVVRTEELTPEGYGKYFWTSDPAKTRCGDGPCQGDGKPIVDVAALRASYDELLALDTPEARAAYLDRMLAQQPQPDNAGMSVSEIIATMDSRGAWVTDEITVNEPNAHSEAELHPVIRGISTGVFINRMSALIESVQTTEGTE